MIQIACCILLLSRAAHVLGNNELVYKWSLSPDPERHSTGYRLTGSEVIQKLTGHSATLVTQCSLACLRHQSCRSYNFSPDLKVCELNTDTHDSHDPDLADSLELDADEKYLYFTRDAFYPEGLPGVGQGLECHNGGYLRLYFSSDGLLMPSCVCTRDWTSTTCQEPADKVTWSEWSDWSQCSGSCGTGVQTRNRTCISNRTRDVTDDSLCYGRSREMRECQLRPCVEYHWLPWSPWTRCTTATTCGQGVQRRTRECIHVTNNETSSLCYGESSDVTVCEAPSCDAPVKLINSVTFGNGDVTVYDDIRQTWRQICGDEWSAVEANVVCRQLGFGKAVTAFVINMTSEAPASEGFIYNVTCHGNEQSVTSCEHADWNSDVSGVKCRSSAGVQCVVNGGWGSWSSWSNCSTSCGDGVMTRFRSCDYPEPRYGGDECHGNSTQYKVCTNPPCKVDGRWMPWSEWSPCSVTCDNGTRWRHRQCDPPRYGGAACQGSYNESVECRLDPCPADGIWLPWSEWSQCSVTCDNGTTWRHRQCEPPLYGGAPCQGNSNESEVCFPGHCPVDGVWHEWSSWSDCSVTCGSGVRSRQRLCEAPLYGGVACRGPENETAPCLMEDCTVPGFWQTWESWQPCSVTCGGGIHTRNRVCLDEEGRPIDVINCNGSDVEHESCHQFDCLPYARTCTELVEKGLRDSAAVEIDPAQTGSPFWVRCNVEDGIGITEITHDRMSRKRVSGYEVAGQFRMELTYNATMDDVIHLVDASATCRQFIQWQCLSATIKNPHDPDEAMTYWANRYGEERFYWGGATPDSDSCACGMNHSCANPEKRCNCDANDQVYREDSGYVEEKDDLPITIFFAGDTGGMEEVGNVTIGPLQCFDTVSTYSVDTNDTSTQPSDV